MNELKAYDFHGKKVIDSREVAKLVEKRHNDLLRDIRGYIEIMEKSGERKIAHSDFFIKSSYKSEQNKEMPCCLLTKKGCDMVANKLTGEKGVLFTAAYVNAFEEMRQAIAASKPALNFPDGVSLNGLARLISVTRRVMLDMGSTPTEVGAMTKTLFDTCGIPVPLAFTKQIPGQLCLFDHPALQN